MPLPTRAELGRPLTWSEADDVIEQVNDNKSEIDAHYLSLTSLDGRMGVAESDINALESRIGFTGRYPIVISGTNAYHLIGAISNPTFTNAGKTTNSTFYIPFSVPRDLKIASLYVNVTTGGSRTCFFAIYNNKIESNEDVPNTRLAGITSGFSAASTGYAGNTMASYTLTAGVLYWLGFGIQSSGSGTPQFSHTPVANVAQVLGYPAGSLGTAYTHRSESGAVIPATAGSTTLSDQPILAPFAVFSRP